ncbi:hypothetical protein FQZ97_1179620 [compost metagenome]
MVFPREIWKPCRLLNNGISRVTAHTAMPAITPAMKPRWLALCQYNTASVPGRNCRVATKETMPRSDRSWSGPSRE